MFNNDELIEDNISQMDIYSPVPKIKIKKWYMKICIACTHVTHDYGEYDSVGCYECEESQKLGNLKFFPYCSAKNCNKFNPTGTDGYRSDYWQMIMDFDKAFKEDGYIKLHNLLQFNERMGNYKVGRII